MGKFGKYDDEIKTVLFSFTPTELTNLSDINKKIQECYKLISQYYMCTVTLNEVQAILAAFEQELNDTEKLKELIKKYKNQYSSNTVLVKSEIIDAIQILGNNALTLLCVISGKSDEEIKQELLELYQVKNPSYNDVWYERGTPGVCVDINRKVSRLQAVIDTKVDIVDGETVYETAKDTLLMSTFLFVSAYYIDENIKCTDKQKSYIKKEQG